MSQQSCLVARFNRFIELTDTERTFIAEMERDERDMAKGQTILDVGDAVRDIFVLKFGWAVVRSIPVRGHSAIVRAYLPGEVIGLAEISRTTAVHSLVMHTDGIICPFPRAAFSEIYQRAPRLAALLASLSSLDQIDLRDRIAGLTTLTAEERVIHFLVSLRDRLSVGTGGKSNRFQLPFTQTELGDLLGMTQVYMNKRLRQLVRDGYIEMQNRHVRTDSPRRNGGTGRLYQPLPQRRYIVVSESCMMIASEDPMEPWPRLSWI